MHSYQGLANITTKPGEAIHYRNVYPDVLFLKDSAQIRLFLSLTLAEQKDKLVVTYSTMQRSASQTLTTVLSVYAWKCGG